MADTRQFLDERLSAVADFVRSGSACADIGCDHGKLSVFLAKSGKCKRVFACDKSKKPLDKAMKAIERAKCNNVECRMGDGLSVVDTNEVDDVVIAGLSGVTIAQLLATAPQFWHEKHRFILVPASKADYLRRFLCENGFCLTEEKPVIAANRVYTVMHVKYTGEVIVASPVFCAVGLIKGETKAAKAYMEKILNQLKKQSDFELAKEVEQWFLQNK